jgi:SAM-dependent methyltransferase
MLDEHLRYVADQARIDLFRAAIGNAVRPGSRVVDVGCGSGVLGLLCLRAGASHVFAIDDSDMIDIARRTLSLAGLANKATFIRGRSERVVIDKPVDAVICDHVGYFGFDYGIAHTMQDARRRFLGPAGVVIPARIRLELSAVAACGTPRQVDGWGASTVPADFHWCRRLAVNTKYDVQLSGDLLLADPVGLGEIDLSANQPDFFRWSADLRIARSGVMHGLAGWFQCELAEGIWMTNSPLSEGAIDRPQAFLPIDEAMSVRAGDRVTVTIMARPGDNLIAWDVEFRDTGRRFRQSTWKGMMVAPGDRVRANPAGIPRVGHAGHARSAVLGYCDGVRTTREIEQAVLRDHPDLFPSPEETLRFVAQVLARDTE